MHAKPNRAQDNLHKISTQYFNVYGQKTLIQLLIFVLMLEVKKRKQKL